ncbi:MAG: hypothetical protein HC916_14970 [Coleofasciculaceae cyanobacterium SM2_1_6]|nr:hypothetical protein [Coleofasciculaceae cyanobacterium SM2_1_6]
MSKGNKNNKANSTNSNKTREISAFFTAQRVVYAGIAWAVAALLFFLLFGIGEDRPLWYTIGTYIFEQGAFFAAALLCLKNWTSPQIASGRNVWLGIGLGNFCFGFGGFLFGFWELYWGLDPAVSPGDLFYFLFYILVSWGMLWAVIPRKITLERWQWLTIVGIASLGIAIAAVLTITAPAEATIHQQFAQATPTTPISPTPTITPTITPTATTPPTPRVSPATSPVSTPAATPIPTPATTPTISPTVISPSPSPIPSPTATPSPATTPTTTPTATPTATPTPSLVAPSPIEAEEPETETVAYGGAPPQFILDMEKQLEPFAQIVALAYVIGDVFLLIIATILLLAFWGGRFAQSWRMVAAASFCMYIADMWFKYASERIPNYQSGSVLEVFWVFSGVLFGIGAALEYDNSMRTRRGGRKRA